MEQVQDSWMRWGGPSAHPPPQGGKWAEEARGARGSKYSELDEGNRRISKAPQARWGGEKGVACCGWVCVDGTGDGNGIIRGEGGLVRVMECGRGIGMFCWGSFAFLGLRSTGVWGNWKGLEGACGQVEPRKFDGLCLCLGLGD